mmetsp:Transcript_57127/g.185021  ORF Transcript_57127/g.185021 Transcript_57127/m.185021 type:complete len:116 (+) Transcript_57127:59-406(+)
MPLLKFNSIITLTAVGAVIAAGSDSAFLGKKGAEVHANVFDCHSCDECVVGENLAIVHLVRWELRHGGHATCRSCAHAPPQNPHQRRLHRQSQHRNRRLLRRHLRRSRLLHRRRR